MNLHKLSILGAILMTTLSAKADDKAFFFGVHLGMTIDAARAYYHKLGNVGELWHSGAPPGEGQSDFRTGTFPQRRVYVYYRKADGKIVSVLYWKLGDGESFSAAERSYLTDLNRGHGALTTKVIDPAEFEVTTRRQAQIEAGLE